MEEEYYRQRARELVQQVIRNCRERLARERGVRRSTVTWSSSYESSAEKEGGEGVTETIQDSPSVEDEYYLQAQDEYYLQAQRIVREVIRNSVERVAREYSIQRVAWPHSDEFTIEKGAEAIQETVEVRAIFIRMRT